ncbi:MAG: GNAT family N-acetyltransferase, partial [Verrucomicrobiota bacterium]|nr:GNAT family N-acetyltransferase [Verrucomicrobiota bacterium]
GEEMSSLGTGVEAAKLIGLVNGPGVLRDGQPLHAVSCSALADLGEVPEKGGAIEGVELLEAAAAACQAGVPRVHILDGRRQGVLAEELFSNEGVGTMVHADSYRQVRALREDDVPELLAMIGRSVRASHLVPRDYDEILEKAEDFLILCVDDNVVGCVALHRYEEHPAEVACLYVKQSHEGLGYGRALVESVEERARGLGISSVFVFTSRAVPFFENLGYDLASMDIVPNERARKFEESNRGSEVLAKELT